MIREFTDAGLIQQMHDFNLIKDTRVAFSFVTEEEDGSFKFHERRNQPCYGELRKYSTTHPGKTTDTDVRRPSDLKTPFPDTGNPVAASFSYANRGTKPEDIEIINRVIQYLHSKHSPYKKGFGLGKRIEFTKNPNGLIVGVVVKTGDLDPTVLVALQISLRNLYSRFSAIQNYINAGMKFEHAVLLVSATTTDPFINGHITPATYSFQTSNLSFERYFGQNPRDFTGGSFYDRYDYSRPNIMNLFQADTGEVGVNFCALLKEKIPVEQTKVTQKGVDGYDYTYTLKKIKIEDVVTAVKEILSDY